ncbi:hypothetical protein V1511DRAFT_505658 [Dipodascopsis uninucleata]
MMIIGKSGEMSRRKRSMILNCIANELCLILCLLCLLVRSAIGYHSYFDAVGYIALPCHTLFKRKAVYSPP